MNILKFLSFTFVFFISFTQSFAQEDATIFIKKGDTTLIAPDTTTINPRDTVGVNGDTLETAKPKSSIETTINYNARDSINFDVVNKIVKLYGDAKITYGTIELTAAKIDINYQTHIIHAVGVEDTAGNVEGKPVFTDAGQVYYTDEITYNFKTKKAISKGVVTEQGEANMRGTTVYKNQVDELFISEAMYTTCNLPDPHFHIQTEKIKLIPNNKVISGPGYIAVKGIPTPIGFPFGIFPMPNKKSSGIVFPTYGEEKRRGFFLRNGGYYFAFSDYVDLELLGEIYSKGSWGLNLSSSYIKKYKYSGFLSMRYNNQTALSEIDSTVVKDFWVNWNHSPKSTGAGRFSASVNFGTSSYNQNNPTLSLDNTLRQDFNSSVSYSTAFRGTPFTLSVRGRFQQNVNTRVVNLLLPELSLNMSRINPLKFLGGSGSSFWEKLNLSYSMNASNQLTNNRISLPGDYNVVNVSEEEADSVLAFGPSNFDALWQRAQNGMQHSIPISTSIKFLKFFTLSPSVSYNETWYFKKLDYEFIPEQNGVEVDTLQEFSRFYRYSGGASLNTNIYGTAYFKKGYVRAIRHVIRPSVSMSFSPDFSADRFDIYQEVQTDTSGTMKRLSRYNGFIYGTPTAGKSATMSFSVANNLEMKVKSKSDTTGEFKKVAIFENLNFGTSYNFLADSFRLSNINFSARTSLFNKKLSVNFSSTLDPYYYQLDSIYQTTQGERVSQKRRNIYAWNAGKGIGQITSARVGLSMNFRPKGAKETAERLDELDESSLTEEEKLVKDLIKYNPELYVDFTIPWTINLNYNLNYSKRGYQEAEIRQEMQFSGQITLTDKWAISYRSGFDIQNREFTTTSFDVSRDLHCWQMHFTWVPFGRYESYHLTVNAKSSLLQDLRINRQRSWWDR